MTTAIMARRDVENAWRHLAANQAQLQQMLQPRQRQPAVTARQRPSRALAVDPSAGWDAWASQVARFARDKKLAGWLALDAALAYADLKIADLEKRLATLEEKPAPAVARATPLKPLNLRLMRTINDASVAPLIEKIEAAHGREVRITLMSEGGEVEAARRLADAIVAHGNVKAHAVVNCDSASTLLFAAAHKRSALKNTTFLFHAPTLGDGNRELSQSDQRRLDRVAREMAAFIAKRSGSKTAAILRLMTPEGNVLDANAASELGLLNGTIRRPHEPKNRKGK